VLFGKNPLLLRSNPDTHAVNSAFGNDGFPLASDLVMDTRRPAVNAPYHTHRRCSSGVEQLIRNEQVVGSNPTSGSIDYQWLWKLNGVFENNYDRPACPVLPHP